MRIPLRLHAPCRRSNEGNARSDESKGLTDANRDKTQTEHEWDGMGDGDGRNRLQMAGDGANDSQALTGGHITKYRTLVARISVFSKDLPDLKFASLQVSLQQSGGMEAYVDDGWRGD